MSRRLRWALIITVVAGVQAALVARLTLPSEGSLYWTFSSDPASLIVLIFIVAALFILGLRYAFQWFENRQEALQVELTERQEAERRRFIQRLDHELKNPLTAIQIQLDNLQDAGDTQASLEDVRDQADRLVNLTRGLRRLADRSGESLVHSQHRQPSLVLASRPRHYSRGRRRAA